MSKALLIAAIAAFCVFLWNTPAHCQSSDSINIRVAANVIKSIELVTIRNMRVDNVQPGQKEIALSPVTDSGAGKMIARGTPGAQIRVSYFEEWQLNNGRSSSLTFRYRLAGNAENKQNTAELLLPDNRGLRFNKDGEFFFWVGGRVNIENAQPGTYEGEFTIEIEYI